MAQPTKTLASLAGRMQDLPVRFYRDSTDSNPFATIIDENGRALAFGINLSALVGATGLLAAEVEAGEISTAELAALAVTEPKIAAGALPASAAGRAKIATDYFDAATVLDLFAAGALTTANLDVLIADDQLTEALVDKLLVAGAIDGADRIKAASIISDRIVAATIADDRMASFIEKNPGQIAVGRLDFGAEGTENCIITIGAVTYTEEETATDITVGEWDNGGSASVSATNLAAAINGDERNGGGPSYAALASGGTVFIMALAVGVAGNVSVSASEASPDAVENLIGGAAAAVKQVARFQHVVTAEEGDAVEVIIPLPFDAAIFEWHVYDSTGGILVTEVTDRGTVTAASSPIPAYFKIATNGATHVTAGQIIRLTVQR